MKVTPVRFRLSRRPRLMAALPALALALAFATPAAAGGPAGSAPAPKGRTVNVYGRTVRVTIPAGMELLPVTEDMAGVPYARFLPQAQAQRPGVLSFENMPYTAKANAEAEMNTDDSTAVRSIALLAAEPMPASDTAEAEDLRKALRSGLAGGRNLLLTGPPEGVALLDRIESSRDGVVDLTTIGKRGDFTLVGRALILVNGRAIWLRIIRLNPETESDLVGVREAIIHWVREIREANLPAKK
jgi:hypothetical protein